MIRREKANIIEVIFRGACMEQNIRELIHKFHLEKEENLLSDILFELGNRNLWMPGNFKMEHEDVQKCMNAKEGDAITTSKDMYFTPDYLRSGEELFFPLFIAKEDSPEEYRNRVSWMNVTLNQAASLTLKDDTLAGMVVNAFTEPFIITREFLDYLSNKMNSHVVPKGTEISFMQLDNNEESMRLGSVIKVFADSDKTFHIRKIYAAIFEREQETSYLIMIDAAGQDYETIFRQLNVSLMKAGKWKYPIDFCPWSQAMEKELVNYGLRPIWDWMRT